MLSDRDLYSLPVPPLININTGAVVVDVNSVGVKAIENAGAALIADDIDANKMYQIIYDGTAFQIMKIAL